MPERSRNKETQSCQKSNGTIKIQTSAIKPNTLTPTSSLTDIEEHKNNYYRTNLISQRRPICLTKFALFYIESVETIDNKLRFFRAPMNMLKTYTSRMTLDLNRNCNLQISITPKRISLTNQLISKSSIKLNRQMRQD